jgi:hypothetical protein
MTIDEIVKNKEELIKLKKAANKYTDAIRFTATESPTFKAENNGKIDSNEIIYRTIVANTYNWMDSHDDVHIEGIFTKSINENSNKIFHLHDHLYRLTAKVGNPESVYEKQIAWVDLGVAKAGATTALFMDTAIKRDLNTQIYSMYKDGEITQHSVGMAYVKIFLAVNDDKYKDEFAAWNKYFPLVGNQQRAIDKGYFWAVTEAKLYEISAVIAGSNELTPTLEPISTQTKEAEKKAPEIDFEYLINNFKLKNQ